MSKPLHDAEFIEPPIEAESDSRYVWKLRKALNGLKKASQLFSNYLSDILVDTLGFEKCSLAPTAFYHRETDIRTAIHVDDPLTLEEVDIVMRFYDSLKQWLLVRVQDVVGTMKSSIYLGCRYWRLGHCYVEAATEHYFEDSYQLQIRCDTLESSEPRQLQVPRRRGHTFNLPPRRREVAVHCGTEARFVVPLEGNRTSTCEPRGFDMIGLKRIMRYISGTENYKPFSGTGKRTTVTATCDTDWAGCAETRRSTTCVCIDW